MATKEIYRIGIQVGVDGVEESKQKLSAMEKYTQQTEKRIKMLNKITASPTAKLKDKTSSAIDKINAKSKNLSRAAINPTAKLNDQATSKLNRISTTIKKLENTNITANLRINDQASSYLSKVHAPNNKLKSTNINPTAKIAEHSLDKLELNKAKSEMMELDGEFKTASMSMGNSLDKVENKAKSASKSVSSSLADTGSSIQKAGKEISDVGNKMTMGLTLPLVGVGVAGAKVGMDFDAAMSRVKAISGATGDEFEQLKKQAIDLGASTAFSAKEAASGQENLASAGFDTKEIMTAMPGMLDLAASSGEDLASSADIAASTLRGFGLAADRSGHVADVLAKNAGATNAAVRDTGEAMKYIAPVAQTAGWSLESVAASIGELANSGIKGSQAGTILRATFSRLAKPSDESAKAMQAMGFSAYDSQHKMKSLSAIVTDLQKSTAKMTDEQKQNTIAQVFGEEAMSGILTLIKNGPEALDSLTQSYKNSDGAAKEMATTMQDNAKSSIEQMVGSMETAAIKVEESFAPMLRDAADYVGNLADKFAALTPEQQMFYVKMLAGAAAIGPVLKLVGGLTSGIGGLISIGSKIGSLFGTTAAIGTAAGGGISGLLGGLASIAPVLIPIIAAVGAIGIGISANNSLMEKSCTTTVEELGPVEKIMNELHGHINKSKSELIEAGLIYDDFGDGVSDSFKKAAQDASKSLLKLEMNINKLVTDNHFDEADNNQLKNWVNDMAYEGINAIKSKQSEIKSELSKTFSLDGVTSTAEQGTLDYMDKFFGEGVNKELEIRDQMYAIGNKAIKDHGKLLEDDLKQLRDKAAELQAVKLEYANAENAREQAYTQSKFASKAESVTGINSASELLQERAKEHQNSIVETKANYDGTIAETQYHLDHDKNLTDTDRTNLQNTINENQAAKDEALKQAEAAWKSDLKTLYAAYPKAEGQLNEKTGERFSDKDIKRNQTLGTMTNSKFAGLTDVKENGMYSLINNDTGKYESVYAEVDKATGEVIGAYSYCSGQVGGYTAEMANSAKKSALEISNSNFQITSTLDTVKSASVNAAGEMIGDGDRVISQLGQLQTAQDGTLYRTMSINGTPINVKVDSSGAITNLDEVRIKADEASKGRSVEITSNTTDETTKAKEYTTTMEAIPPNTDAYINSNASEVTSQTSGLLGKLQYITSHPWTAFLNFVKGGSSSSDEISRETTDSILKGSREGLHIPTYHADTGTFYASGTNNAKQGVATVGEEGYEVVFGRQKRWFNGGEKVLNHQQSKSFLQDQQNNEPFQVKQGQYQLAQPQQVQVASAGGNNVQVDVQVNGGNQDIEGLIVEVTQEVGRKLKEALTNIKK